MKTMRGQSLVEFALLLPLLLLILAGVVDLGRMMTTQVILINAARQGARVAAGGATIPDIQQAVIDEPGSTMQISAQDINISISDQSVTVTVHHTLSLMLGSIFGFNSLGLSSSATFPILR